MGTGRAVRGPVAGGAAGRGHSRTVAVGRAKWHNAEDRLECACAIFARFACATKLGAPSYPLKPKTSVVQVDAG
jgi:hypothetical protein